MRKDHIKADEGVRANGVGSEDADSSKGAESLLKRAGFTTARKQAQSENGLRS